MKETLNITRDILLTPADLTENRLQDILSQALVGQKIDSADIYLQAERSESWVLEDGIIKEGSFDISRGAGIRVISGEKSGFAYSNDIVLPALEQAAQAARSIVQQGQQGQLQAFHAVTRPTLYTTHDPLMTLSQDEKI